MYASRSHEAIAIALGIGLRWVNAKSTIELLERILDKNPDKKVIYAISDNARYYRSRVLQVWLENHPEIVWIWLPTYSSNLNLIERLWGFTACRGTRYAAENT